MLGSMLHHSCREVSRDAMEHPKSKDAAESGTTVDCGADPIQSLTTMFVDMVQKGRINAGQCPAMRPVFLKPHGIAHGVFRLKKDIPPWARVGLFAGEEYPLWIRFSSDTLPTISDFTTTLGVALK